MSASLAGKTPGGSDATFKWLAHFGADAAFPADGETPQILYKGDGTPTPLSFTTTKAFLNGLEAGLAPLLRTEIPYNRANAPLVITGTLLDSNGDPVATPVTLPQISDGEWQLVDGDDQWDAYFFAVNTPKITFSNGVAAYEAEGALDARFDDAPLVPSVGTGSATVTPQITAAAPGQGCVVDDGVNPPRYFLNLRLTAGEPAWVEMPNLASENLWLGLAVFGGGFTVNSAVTFGPLASFAYIGGSAAAHRAALLLGTLATQSGTFSGTSSGTNTGDQNVPAEVNAMTTITGAKTFTTSPKSTGALTGDLNEIGNISQIIALQRQYDGVMLGSDAIRNPSTYRLTRAFQGSTGMETSLAGDAAVGGVTLWGPTSNFAGRSFDSIDMKLPTANGRAHAMGFVSTGSPSDAGPLTCFGNQRACAAVRLGCPDYLALATGMTGRRYYFGVGTMTAGASSNLTKGGLGVCMAGDSDYIQLWNGTAWSDTVLRWKNGSTHLNSVWDFEMISNGSSVSIYGRIESVGGTGAWTLLGQRTDGYNANGYGADWLQVIVANLVDDATFDADTFGQVCRVKRLSISGFA